VKLVQGVSFRTTHAKASKSSDTIAPSYSTIDDANEPKDEGVFSSYEHADRNSDQNKNKEMQNMHGIYGQWCMLNYDGHPSGSHACMRHPSADAYDVAYCLLNHMQI
jgi:hypothetical protein